MILLHEKKLEPVVTLYLPIGGYNMQLAFDDLEQAKSCAFDQMLKGFCVKLDIKHVSSELSIFTIMWGS